MANKPAREGLPITPRELEILELVFQGMTNKVIATHLNRSPLTVKNHLQKIFAKLGVHGAEARVRSIYVGLRMGLIKPPVEVLDPRQTLIVEAPLLETVPDRATTVCPDDWVRFGNILLSPSFRVVRVEREVLNLSRQEFNLLLVFVMSPGHVFTRQGLLDRAWGGDVFVVESVVDVHVHKIRVKLKEVGASGNILTVLRVGYKFGLALIDPLLGESHA